MTEEIAVVVGRVLRHARQSRGLTLRDVGLRSGGAFKPTAVAGYERGERAISLERLFELCRLYEIPPERLIAEISRIVEGHPPVVVDLQEIEGLGSTEALLVADFVHEVRGMRRRTPPGDTVTLRAGDLEVLASASGHRPDELLPKIAPALEPA